MRLFRYTLLRLAVLAAVVGVLYLLGMRSWLLALASVVIAALVSYLVLPRARLDAAGHLAEHDPLRARTHRRAARGRDTRSAAQRDADDEDAQIDTTRL